MQCSDCAIYCPTFKFERFLSQARCLLSMKTVDGFGALQGGVRMDRVCMEYVEEGLVSSKISRE